MRMLLIRHGRQNSTKCNVNVELASEGKEQVALLAKRLVHYPIDAIYASDLLRARETAEIIARKITDIRHSEIEVKVRAGIREIDFGELEGIENSQVKVVYENFMKERALMMEDLAFPGGECGQDVYERAMRVLEEVIDSSCECAVLVMHGGTIRSLVTGILGMEQAKKLMFGKKLEHTSITEIAYHRKCKQFTLERFNDYAHLEANPMLLRENW